MTKRKRRTNILLILHNSHHRTVTAMSTPQHTSSSPDAPTHIIIKGARVNNLKNIDLNIPLNRLVVVTGLSGSGKSSLAFDTLYAEGRRRYVESLSAYARQFLGRMQKPECDYIKNLPPAIAIEQKVSTRNPRSTVGTSTEVYDYLRLLYARIGHTFSPLSGTEVKRHTPDDVVATVAGYSPGTRYTVLAPLRRSEGRTLRKQLLIYMEQGLSRLDADGEMVRIEDFLARDDNRLDQPTESLDEDTPLWLLIDRGVADGSKDALTRLTDSVETAFYEGDGVCLVRIYPSGVLHRFSTRFEADGLTFQEPDDHLFSFNSPLGACPRCEGFGRIIGIDEQLVVPDSSKSVYDGAVACWRGEKMGLWREAFCRKAPKADFPIFTPYHQLTTTQRDTLWHGRGGLEDVCLDAFFKMLEGEQYKIQYRVMLARYRGKTICPDCRGRRLRPEAENVKIGGRSLPDLVDLPLSELKRFFDNLQLSAHDAQVAARLLPEIQSRLQFLTDVGLDYLTLNRPSATLSGGESQRINLATSLGSSLVGSLYILDEPSVGLHPRDTERLIGVLKRLRDLGNTVVVVEHDEEIIRAADHIIDIGPEAGRHGGEVVWQGPYLPAETSAKGVSHTLDYLNGAETIAVPSSRRAWNRHIDIIGARAHNLKGIDVRFPLGVLTVVTGVSGSGKSTLVKDILYPALCRHLDIPGDRPGEHIRLEGDLDAIEAVEMVDQSPIGRSSRSNPATYVKAYDEIRRIMAAQPLSKQMGFTASTFSFNAEGGRCENCKGEGVEHVEMQFMADLILECEACKGKRFKKEVLDVTYHGQNIHDILEMTINQAVEFFGKYGDKTVVKRLKPLQEVGLGYIKLGQSGSSLSGGESQRVKLAAYLAREQALPTVFIFDEPTTGLHFHDIATLLHCFAALIERGHTIIIVEHNPDVMKTADYLIDLGPEGGRGGGNLVGQGTPEAIVETGKGYTARVLKGKL